MGHTLFHARNDQIKRQHGKDAVFYTDKDSARWSERPNQEQQLQFDQGWQKIIDQMRMRGAAEAEIQHVLSNRYPNK